MRTPRARPLWRIAARALPILTALALLLTSCAGSIPLPLATAIPSPTLPDTPGPSPTPTPAPTATPAPPLPPGEALEAGLIHQRNGNYAAAIAAYQGILSSQPDTVLAREALYHLGEVYPLDEDYVAAADALQRFRQRYPEDERYLFATFRLATAYDELAMCDEAIAAYQEYAAQRTIISDYVHLFIAYDTGSVVSHETHGVGGTCYSISPVKACQASSASNDDRWFIGGGKPHDLRRNILIAGGEKHHTIERH